ncbi:MAG: cytochrome c oxidase subunit 3, partial [Hyphomicrobiales bacterium]|nr:cytochrome c oxidase subunit 3 [Hyphomicrobiales bacterium]
MTDSAIPDRPGFHLVDPSPWPIVGAGVAFLSAFGLILSMHGMSFGPAILTIGVAGILFTMYGWWRDVVIEAQGGHHNILVRHGLTIGMILFIASEVMFFVAWFWAFFWNALDPSNPQTYGLLDFSGGIWPPKGTEVINPLQLPLMNTFVLLTSSAAVNVAHDNLREGNRSQFKIFLALGIAL